MHKSHQELLQAFDLPQASWRSEDWGEMHVSYEVYRDELDVRPHLKGLPDDQCECPHWGYVIKGRLRALYDDREEEILTGEAYYLPPGHAIIVDAGTELIEFSPRDAFDRHMAAVEANLRARKG